VAQCSASGVPSQLEFEVASSKEGDGLSKNQCDMLGRLRLRSSMSATRREERRATDELSVSRIICTFARAAIGASGRFVEEPV
jgi:hypothetical protein